MLIEKEIVTKIGEMWRELPEKEKEPFKLLA